MNLKTDRTPPHYGLAGDGRLARHLRQYFQLRGLTLSPWSRSALSEPHSIPPLWSTAWRDCPVILLAVSDAAIEPLAREIRNTSGFEDRMLIHFSGALSTQHAWSFHPLMSFGPKLYSLTTYESIAFIGEKGGPDFSKIFPTLRNPSALLEPSQKALYHAWCVMGGNFTAFLWSRMFETFAQRLEIPPTLAFPYLKQVTENLFAHANQPQLTWTGPLVRGDLTTIESHLEALKGDPYEKVYRAFTEAHWPRQGTTPL